ncbi:hypothetical protein [Paraburkholderia sp. BCC1884]|uniref:hypothetical protein n=1 Tax=Paraburkholderia sp. BCC1884 TaxID=2562668 RepID=UPI0021B37B24|nr:hypothetical protein [Paraburkholderia sp. BCC1884]
MDEHQFKRLFDRARADVDRLTDTACPRLYFDSIDLLTDKFFDLIRHLLASQDEAQFCVLSLKPDPFGHFSYFEKYPAFLHGAKNTVDDYYDVLHRDPGNSPADAIAYNAIQYVVLPIVGDWFMYADRDWQMGALSGPSDVMELARGFYPFFLTPEPGFRITGN